MSNDKQLYEKYEEYRRESDIGKQRILKELDDIKTIIRLQHQILDIVHDQKLSNVQGTGIKGVDRKFVDYWLSLMATIADQGTRFNLQDKNLDLVYSEIEML